MANFTLNIIFASIFASFAWNSLPRGWRFFKLGWFAMRANVSKSKNEFNVEEQRERQISSNFLIAGLAWLVGGTISAILTIMLVLFAFFDVGIFNLIS